MTSCNGGWSLSGSQRRRGNYAEFILIKKDTNNQQYNKVFHSYITLR